jgi:hypothetical protein
MTMHDNEGFEVRRGGVVSTTTNRSIFGQRLVAGRGTITKPVPGLPDVFFKVLPGEVARLTADEVARITQQAREWYAAPPSKSKAGDSA